MPRFADGQRVRLVPFEDQPEQYAIVDGYEGGEFNDGMYVVTLEREYWGPEERDGLREVHESQMEELR